MTLSHTDLHAGVLAIAYQAHVAAGRAATFGHVKAEKIAHMAEAWCGIELGRMPVKDAAGPNDYQQLKRVEHRAKMAGFFSFWRKGDRYQVTTGPHFDRLIADAAGALSEQRKRQLDELVALMLPMDTTQAEIVATVFAAWNNLLLDGKQPTDEQIVREAREEWHKDKLKIERKRFFEAVAWMRVKGVVPAGTGKRVLAKAG